MLAEERRFRIQELLSMQRTVTASELRSALGVTAATVRRDLAALEKQGVLLRSHGGAISRTSTTNFHPPQEAIGGSHSEEKEAIAREAERLILDGETILLEGSTTVYEVARRLYHRNRLTIVTNSPAIVYLLQRSQNVSVISTGGELQKNSFYLSGAWAQQAISEIRVDKAIIGASAIDPAYGISTTSQSEAQIKRLMIKAARVCIAVADHSKFGNQGFAYVGPVNELDVLITDSGTDPKHLGALREAGVELIVADVRTQASDSGRGETVKPRARASSGKRGRTIRSLDKNPLIS